MYIFYVYICIYLLHPFLRLAWRGHVCDLNIVIWYFRASSLVLAWIILLCRSYKESRCWTLVNRIPVVEFLFDLPIQGQRSNKDQGQRSSGFSDLKTLLCIDMFSRNCSDFSLHKTGQHSNKHRILKSVWNVSRIFLN